MRNTVTFIRLTNSNIMKTNNYNMSIFPMDFLDYLRFTQIERQRQRQWPMPVYGDASKSIPDPFPSVTIDQHWPLTLPLGVGGPLH